MMIHATNSPIYDQTRPIIPAKFDKIEQYTQNLGINSYKKEHLVLWIFSHPR